jgi:hypothetical protein
MREARKPRKAAAKKPARKAAAQKATRTKRIPFEQTEPTHTVGKALLKAVKAFGGNKGALAAYLGMKQPNLSRALRESRDVDAGTKDKVVWPAEYVLPLARISGVAPHELAPAVYEPHMKVKRVKVADLTGAKSAE